MFPNLNGKDDKPKRVAIYCRVSGDEQAEDSGGVLVEGGEYYVKVTFAEKPSRTTRRAQGERLQLDGGLVGRTAGPPAGGCSMRTRGGPPVTGRERLQDHE